MFNFSVLNILMTVLFCTALYVACGTGEEEQTDPSELFAAAGDAYSSGDLNTAHDLLTEVSVLDPGNPNVWRNLGTVSLDLGLYDQAITAYQRVIEIDSTRVDVLTDLTGALLGVGRVEEALHTGRLATQIFPEDGIAFNNYGMALMESGNYEDAASCFNTAYRREPENASILYNCGRITLFAGNPEEALLFFQGSISAAPEFLQPQIEAARTYGILGRHTEAEEQILSVLALYPSNPDALNILALSYSSQGRQEEAIVVMESILESNPNDLICILGLAECFYLYGDLPRALENYQLFMLQVDDTTGTSDIRLRIDELEALCD